VVGCHSARTLMRCRGLRAYSRRKFIRATESNHSRAVATYVLNREFKLAESNQAWAGDAI